MNSSKWPGQWGGGVGLGRPTSVLRRPEAALGRRSRRLGGVAARSRPMAPAAWRRFAPVARQRRRAATAARRTPRGVERRAESRENIRGWVGRLVVGVDGRRCYVGIDENEKKCSAERKKQQQPASQPEHKEPAARAAEGIHLRDPQTPSTID